jgi:hypothetical protein
MTDAMNSAFSWRAVGHAVIIAALVIALASALATLPRLPQMPDPFAIFRSPGQL